jgi:hypothetical protein
MLRVLALALATLFTGVVGTAHAAQFQVIGGEAFSLPHNYGYLPNVKGVGPGTVVTANGYLYLAGSGKVTFTFLGSEGIPGQQHLFTVSNKVVFDTLKPTNDPVTLRFDGGYLPFGFSTPSAPPPSAQNDPMARFHNSIAFLQTNKTAVLAFFNDYNRWDRDYDEMVVRMDVAPIPLPAAAWLLVAGLGTLAATRRFRAPLHA